MAILAAEVGSRGCRILLIEDETSIAEMYTSVLRLSGHEVQVAHDGTAGLKAAREGDFDLVLLDIRMPGRDGMSVLAELAQDTHSREWPVVMLTNFDDPALRSRAGELGARDYLLKSKVMPRQLAELVPGWARTCG